jgi:hypothetical protein
MFFRPQRIKFSSNFHLNDPILKPDFPPTLRRNKYSIRVRTIPNRNCQLIGSNDRHQSVSVPSNNGFRFLAVLILLIQLREVLAVLALNLGFFVCAFAFPVKLVQSFSCTYALRTILIEVAAL